MSQRRRGHSPATPQFTLRERAAGVLLHPTSLPAHHGVGDLGPAAREFVSFLAHAGQRWWQMLPLNPTPADGCPYSALSAFAGNPLLISLDDLGQEGLLRNRDLKPVRGLRADRVQYPAAMRFKHARLRRAFDAFVQAGGENGRDYGAFCEQQDHWLSDAAMFFALHDAYEGLSWLEWPRGVRLRQERAMKRARNDLQNEIRYHKFVQFTFHKQWQTLRAHAHDTGVGLIGDIPIFVGHDSADVWAHRELFDLRRDGRPRTVSGVPPDLFSRTGQRWGHPHYDWKKHQRTRFAWWLARFRLTYQLVDAVRIDHFLGFNRVWAIPGHASTAQRGKWVNTPGRALFKKLTDELGQLEIIAEDLGLLVPAAAQLRDDFGFPGMRLLQFAFGDEGGRYHQPHNHPRHCVVYPGTHDNDTVVGWLDALQKLARRRKQRAADPSVLEQVLRYAGGHRRTFHWDLIRLAYSSPAQLAIIPMQDPLGLDNRARMNAPATTRGNWQWRLTSRQLTPRLASQLQALAKTFERLPQQT